jgi:hypothetical protein
MRSQCRRPRLAPSWMTSRCGPAGIEGQGHRLGRRPPRLANPFREGRAKPVSPRQDPGGRCEIEAHLVDHPSLEPLRDRVRVAMRQVQETATDQDGGSLLENVAQLRGNERDRPVRAHGEAGAGTAEDLHVGIERAPVVDERVGLVGQLVLGLPHGMTPAHDRCAVQPTSPCTSRLSVAPAGRNAESSESSRSVNRAGGHSCS